MLPTEDVEDIKNSLESGKVTLPHASTLSRARLKADLLLMSMNQHELSQAGVSQLFFSICSDSSPQGGIDWMLTQLKWWNFSSGALSLQYVRAALGAAGDLGGI